MTCSCVIILKKSSQASGGVKPFCYKFHHTWRKPLCRHEISSSLPELDVLKRNWNKLWSMFKQQALKGKTFCFKTRNLHGEAQQLTAHLACRFEIRTDVKRGNLKHPEQTWLQHSYWDACYWEGEGWVDSEPQVDLKYLFMFMRPLFQTGAGLLWDTQVQKKKKKNTGGKHVRWH